MLRVIRLDQDLSGLFSTTSPACDLRDKLKSPLRRTQIRQPQTNVDRNYANERDIWKVMSLGDHLRADEHIEAAGRKLNEHVLHFALVRHRVAVNTCDAHCGELFC